MISKQTGIAPSTFLPRGWEVIDGDGLASGEPVNREFELIKGEKVRERKTAPKRVQRIARRRGIFFPVVPTGATGGVRQRLSAELDRFVLLSDALALAHASCVPETDVRGVKNIFRGLSADPLITPRFVSVFQARRDSVTTIAEAKAFVLVLSEALRQDWRRLAQP